MYLGHEAQEVIANHIADFLETHDLEGLRAYLTNQPERQAVLINKANDVFRLLRGLDQARRMEIVKLGLEFGVSPDAGDMSTTLLHVAAEENDVALVTLLCEHGAKVEAAPIGSLGVTPLLTAALHGSLEALQALIAAGADTDATDIRGHDVLFCALHAGSAPCFRYLYEELRLDFPEGKLLPGIKHLIDRCNEGNAMDMVLILASLLRSDSSLANLKGLKDKEGALYSILQYACSKKLTELCLILLQNAADVHYKREDGSTALHLITEAKIIELLLTYGAEIDARNNEGNTPLLSILLALKEFPFCDNQTLRETATLLRVRGADLDAANNAGLTPRDVIATLSVKKAKGILPEAPEVDMLVGVFGVEGAGARPRSDSIMSVDELDI